MIGPVPAVVRVDAVFVVGDDRVDGQSVGGEVQEDEFAAGCFGGERAVIGPVADGQGARASPIENAIHLESLTGRINGDPARWRVGAGGAIGQRVDLVVTVTPPR